MAVGLAIAQQMMQQQGGSLLGGQAPAAAAPTVPAAAPAAPAAAAGSVSTLPEVLTPAQVAQALAVSEADVLSIIESGELKAKKIGSTYRIMKSGLDAFLAS